MLRIVAGALFDGRHDPIEDAAILLDDDRIVAAGPAGRVPSPEGARTIDLGDRALLPGLIDAHNQGQHDVRHIRPGGRHVEPSKRQLHDVRLKVSGQRTPSRNSSDTFRVEEIMTGGDQLMTVSSSTPLQSAIEAIGSGDFEQVPVVDGGRLVGLLTRADVVRALQIREALELEAPDERRSKQGAARRPEVGLGPSS